MPAHHPHVEDVLPPAQLVALGICSPLFSLENTAIPSSPRAAEPRSHSRPRAISNIGTPSACAVISHPVGMAFSSSCR